MLPFMSAGEPNAAALAEHANAIRALRKRAAADVIEIGRRLTEAKAIAGHGNWLPWLEREFGWDERTARRFISVHDLSLKSDNLSDLGLPVSGLYLLAAASTPEEARAEVIESAEAGETPSVAEIKEIIDQARGKATKGHKQPASRTRLPVMPKSRAKPKLVVVELSPLSWSKANAESQRRFVDAVGIKSLIKAAPPETIYSLLVGAWQRTSPEERDRFRRWIDTTFALTEQTKGDAP
jgi:hypothetical protein